MCAWRLQHHSRALRHVTLRALLKKGHHSVHAFLCALYAARGSAHLVNAVLLSKLLQHLLSQRRLVLAMLLLPLRLPGAGGQVRLAQAPREQRRSKSGNFGFMLSQR